MMRTPEPTAADSGAHELPLDPLEHDRLGIDRRRYDRSRGRVRWSGTEATRTARVTVTDGRRFAVYWLRRSLDDRGPLVRQRIHRIYVCPASGDTAEPVEHVDDDTQAEIGRILISEDPPDGLGWGREEPADSFRRSS
jgi:hypothetical protein